MLTEPFATCPPSLLGDVRHLAFDLDEGTRMFVEDQIREIEGSPPLPAR